MEILLGRFLEGLELENLNEEELDKILAFFSLLDKDIEEYVYGFREAPEEFKNIVLRLRGLS